MRRIITALALAAAVAGFATAASTDAPGIQVGEKAPEFKLKDQNGAERSLGDCLKKGPVALVFIRSADW